MEGYEVVSRVVSPEFEHRDDSASLERRDLASGRHINRRRLMSSLGINPFTALLARHLDVAVGRGVQLIALAVSMTCRAKNLFNGNSYPNVLLWETVVAGTLQLGPVSGPVTPATTVPKASRSLMLVTPASLRCRLAWPFASFS